MKEISFAFALISLFSCNIKNKSSIKAGKYYAAHGFQNEYLIVTNDSNYRIYVGGKFIKSDRWHFLPERSALSFSGFTEIVDWETGVLKTNPRTGTKLFRYHAKGVLDGGYDKLNFIHETLWDTVQHKEK